MLCALSLILHTAEFPPLYDNPCKTPANHEHQNFSSSPEEDALRRDFTVNSLFYKVDTGEVEDFTGKGIEDIQQGLIRTPLEPSVTLAEDPLRYEIN